ncbi:hypothetical protein LIER_35118 [Lithospermum erythrorhizon]|uniref:Nuclease HARBI1 n=1 Tax=Lithospermum erythrorhizon TaxID=34254 RepID=A0AAV3NL35_LITER
MYIDRNTIGGHNLPFQDYFADNIWSKGQNEAGKLGLSALQMVTVAFRMLTYGITGDLIDEYIRIGEIAAIKSIKRFVKAIIHIFGSEYLRSPNTNNIVRLLAKSEQRGTLGMLGSIDCMH